MQDPSKQCSRCGQAKALDEFHRNRSKADGRTDACKPCAREKARSWAVENPDRAAAKSREWLAANRERANANHRAQRLKNLDQARVSERARVARWRQANPFRSSAIRRLSLSNPRFEGGYTAETVDYALVLMGDPCAYCDGPSDTLDHIDADGLNEWENLTAACRRCNASKRQRSLLLALLNHKEN